VDGYIDLPRYQIYAKIIKTKDMKKTFIPSITPMRRLNALAARFIRSVPPKSIPKWKFAPPAIRFTLVKQR